MEKDISNLRLSYEKERFDKSDADPSPIQQFSKWFDMAMQLGELEANAMMLSTVSAEGKPSSRMVLLKEFGTRGFVFFTNYNSRKGKEIAENPNACITFYWSPLEKQVRIEGVIEKISEAESDAYYYSRPHGSQAGAIASEQSSVIENRELLENKFIEIEKQEKLKRPEDWGGYLLIPNAIEFWQGRANRLHDRLRYTLLENGEWKIDRLSP
ncbi:MAG: pyridoxamine 5'-phosphate oxidase [Bacteroidetes bacterium]|nr:pyridoxamine 5'-phosphate oxidase [Bacteroidota bacterium]